MKNPFRNLSDNSKYSSPEHYGGEWAVDDFKVGKVIQTQEGSIERTPTQNTHIANKKYVDDAIVSGAWLKATAQTGLTGNKTGSFNLSTSGTIGGGAITGTSLGSSNLTTGRVVYVANGSVLTDSATFLYSESASDGSLTLKQKGIIKPSADSNLSFMITKANGTTGIMGIDTSNGRIGFASAGVSINIVPTETMVHFASNSASENQFKMETANATAAAGFGMQFKRSRGTYTSPTACSVGDSCGYMKFKGYPNSTPGHLSIAQISGEVDKGTIGANQIAGKLAFYTRPTAVTGSENLIERMNIDSEGNVNISGCAIFTKAGAGLPYGEMWNKADTGFYTIDLTASGAYVDVQGLSGAALLNNFYLSGTNCLVCQKAGTYKISANASVTPAGVGGEYGMKVFVDAVGKNNIYAHEDLSTFDTKTFFASGFASLNSGSFIQLKFDDHANPVTDLVVNACNVNAVMIGG